MILPTSRFVVQFLARVTEDEDGCWIWQGATDKDNGYTRWYAGDTEERWAHRLVFKLGGGVIPDGWTVDHTCHNKAPHCPGGPSCKHRRCLRWDHLEAVTGAVNTKRAAARLPWVHGTAYQRGCRCTECVTTVNEDSRRRYHEARQLFIAGRRDVRHGTSYGYSLGCKCEACSSVALAKVIEYRRRKGVRPFKPAEHGTTSMYTRHKCRCDACRQHWSDYWKAYRAARRRGPEPEQVAG